MFIHVFIFNLILSVLNQPVVEINLNLWFNWLMTTKNDYPLERAIQIAGGQTAIARICEVSPQAVHKWIRKGRVPSHQCLKIELATHSEVSRFVLRPDVFGQEVDEKH